jgi:hypothetical protein
MAPKCSRDSKLSRMLWRHLRTLLADCQHTYFSTQSLTFIKTQRFSPGAEQRKPDTNYVNRITSNIFYKRTISTHNDGRLPVPDLSVQFPLHRWSHAWRTLWRYFIQRMQITNYKLQIFIDSLYILQSISDEITINSMPWIHSTNTSSLCILGLYIHLYM